MKPNDLVYIILVNYNCGKDLLRCVDSIKKINYSNYKILIVDNSSKDSSILSVSLKYEDIEFILNYSNYYFAKAANQGIEKGLRDGAEWIMLLNPDTVVDQNFLTILMETANYDGVLIENLKIFSPLILYMEYPQKIWSAGGRVEFARGDIFHLGLRKDDDFLLQIRVLNMEIDWTSFCCVLIHKSVFDKIGLLDQQFIFYTEDTDFCWRAKKAGFQIMNVSSSRIWHSIPVNPKKRLTVFRLYHKIRGSYLFFKKHADWYNKISIPFFVIGRGIKFIFRRIK